MDAIKLNHLRKQGPHSILLLLFLLLSNVSFSQCPPNSSWDCEFYPLPNEPIAVKVMIEKEAAHGERLVMFLIKPKQKSQLSLSFTKKIISPCGDQYSEVEEINFEEGETDYKMVALTLDARKEIDYLECIKKESEISKLYGNVSFSTKYSETIVSDDR